MIDRNVEKGTVIYIEPETGETIETEITRGKVKCQWKVDWAMRWKALGVDYEMAGKDLIDSVTLSSKICKVLDGNPPEGFNYELFLDDKGQKISKSKGNGLTIDEWLAYAPTESLALYMFLKPKTAKRLYFDVIPKAVDEYYTHLSAYNRQLWKERLNNPVWHIHNGCPPQISLPVSFAMLLNLVSASNAENKEVLWGFISRYAKGANPQTYPMLDQLVEFAIKYFGIFVKPNKKFRIPDEDERLTLAKIDEKLASLPETVDENTIQNALLDVARLTERYQDYSKKSPEGGLVFRMFFFKCSMKSF
ncbi:lysyl-tRNA synthetase, class 1 [Bartonella sp. WD16.2]|nr:lysyl-tRNA synthetase, class 1 [Bartonella sp. WD16.2]